MAMQMSDAPTGRHPQSAGRNEAAVARAMGSGEGSRVPGDAHG